ncbi:MAG: hypothetical protein LBK94_09310, partial [Prevotellaceae bacterium]|nr:hypothetical protein [Prevotellaceae bacterium]
MYFPKAAKPASLSNCLRKPIEPAGDYGLHLHGELTKVRSVADENTVYDIGYKPVHLGDTDKSGSQLRPHIVW